MKEVIQVDLVHDPIECFKIRLNVFIKEQAVPKEMEMDKYDKDAYHFLASVNGLSIGCARARIVENQIKIERVAILKEFRGRGYANSLMKELECIMSKKYPGHDFILNAQYAVEKFYLKLGYKSVGDYFYEAQIKHITMKKTSNYGGLVF